MERKIVISCDSIADIPAELIEKYDIKINPMPLIMGDKTFRDGIDVKPTDLFEYTSTTGKLATTSAPNTEAYGELFKALSADGSEVIHFPISSGMSGSYNFARLAAMELEGIYVVDSKNLSTGVALVVLKACELAEQGLSAAEIVEEVNKIIPKVDASFVIDTLVYLHKGGRCSTVAMLGANVLKLKPCIEVTDGVMAVGKKYRGKMADVLKTYVNDRFADFDDIDTSRVFVTHTCTDPEMAQAIVDQIASLGKFDEILTSTAGCTISAHCGPNTLGVLYIRKSDKA